MRMMDVDLLRPGTVPISPDTILWFEFLINPSLLANHISKASPDPSPTDLIIKFISINNEQKDNDIKIVETESNDLKPNGYKKNSYRSVALKILSLKVAAHLKWNLDILETKLPLPMQLIFLQNLFQITGDIALEIPSVPEFPIDSLTDQLLFTVVLYHRWHLRSIVNRALNNKQSKPQFIHIPGIQEPTYVAPGLIDDIIRKLEAHIPYSVEVLNNVLQSNDIKPKVLTFDTFQILTEDSSDIKQNWEIMQDIPIEEFKCQIHYDLATFHLLREEYKIAQYHITQARNLFQTLGAEETMSYCMIKKVNLDGYCLATDVSVEGKAPSLTQRLHASVKDQYTDILEILIADNVAKEIPIVYRDNVELDIQGGLINRKIVVARDLLLKIQCLNLVRKIVDNDVIQGNYIAEIKSADTRGLDYFFWAIDSFFSNASTTDKHRISRYLLHIMAMSNIIELPKYILSNKNYSSLFNAEELREIKNEAISDEIELPPLLMNNDWNVPLISYTQSKKFHVYKLERCLITSYNPVEIREIVLELDGKNPMNPPWHVNSRWELPIPLQSVVMSLPRGFYQDYSYILLAKSRELTSAKNFRGTKVLLSALEKEIETQNSQSAINLSYKLSKLLGWESVLVEILNYYNTWPTTHESDIPKLIEQCKQCLGAVQITDHVIPRQEIIEYCTIFLLNMAEWDYLCGLEKRWSHCEFVATISAVCQEVIKFKGSRKFPKAAWDTLLIAFGPSRDQPQKRSSSNISGNSTNTNSKDLMASILGTLSKLRERTALTVIISLLARLHNVLRDESSLELYTQHLSLWPASISNANSYNIRTISEFLLQLLSQALKYYPTDVPWLRVMGDLNFVLGHHGSAMKYYLQAIIVANELFSQPVRPLQSVYWRMIKCCAHLQCYTQATVLCQFLEEVNYSLAFKMASSEQKNCASADAMDAYYHCIWDTTILEYLIHLHSKRGEHHRKQLAVKIIGLLELNSNNNEEIQREAANIRKAKFFRALAKQYVY
ncbi:hypothetical protein PV327_008044 [Microctonus hyperodae]|uniref:INTS8 TPR repeats domain-containing protein n=1 Tax=Microctonus hyperodae TaxID=165561 RepID=A0AA39G0H2_MICHY|nr:hypothetical protein PV327_008044 [Microctonus hyperodae]